ncbi:homeodomain transcription factor [Lithospermum erythrorhizon]|uniref:Homeodomain transcription factor n=1 Tax=Lithospermum erythrorhizon TaxID=34254 RepID=A0AAV3RJR2_LITER
MLQPDKFGSQQHMLDMMNHRLPVENELDILRNDDFENNNVVEGASGDDEDLNNQHRKKKHFHRHTLHQIEEMEAFFIDCPHPDEKQRKELSRRLGLEPLQIKFWFQNKRTQIKAKDERRDNLQLRAENEKLRAENAQYKEALSNSTCPNCGGPAAIGEMSFDEQQLIIERDHLQDEIDRISRISAKYIRKPALSYPHISSGSSSRSLGLGPVNNFMPQSGSLSLAGEVYGAAGMDILSSVSIPEADKPIIIELAVAAMEELIMLSNAGEPMWIFNGDNGNFMTLNEDEYMKTFNRGTEPKPLNFKSEASRASAVVIMNHLNLVKMFMDVNQWSSIFAGIVSRAMIVDVFSTGVAGNYNGALQVLTAEFQLPSPIVPTRELYFVRYCKQLTGRSWAVVDVSLDNLRPNSISSSCSRRPSGCLIHELPNGCSKVTWTEHVEVEDRVVNNIYRSLITSGLAFGAKRWVATLDRQCERLASAMSNSIPVGDVCVITSAEGKKNMLKLAERMVKSFCAGVGASTAHTWTTLSGSGSDAVRVMARKSVYESGKQPGIILRAATSFWLPVPSKRVFDFLHDENSRTEWDILSNGGLVQEIAHIANGRDPGNCVSLLRVNVSF